MKKLRVSVGGVTYDVEVEVIEDDENGTSDYGYNQSSMSSQVLARSAVETSSKPSGGNGSARETTHDTNVLKSPIAGVVAKLTVGKNDPVEKGDTVVVLEAMKMFTNISSPTSGRVNDIVVNVGDAVQQGQILMEFA